MALTALNYVQGQYTVAQRDTILTKANKYPDPSQGIGGQVPTLTPDGYVLWRNMPSGEGGTANANIAYIEETSTASRAYVPGDYLIYNGTLYRVTTMIALGATLTVGTNIAAATVATQLGMISNPDLLDNACFAAFVVNQRGQSSYSGAVKGIDRWYGASQYTNVAVNIGYITLQSTATQSGTSYRGMLRQKLEQPLSPSGIYTFSALVQNYAEGQLVFRDGNGTFVGGGASVNIAQTSADTPQLFAITYWGNTTYAPQIFEIFVAGTKSGQIIAAKLECGPLQTLAHLEAGAWVLNSVPDYPTELLKCQRFFQIYRTQSLRPTYGADFRPPMATAQPTLGTISIGGTTYYTASSE